MKNNRVKPTYQTHKRCRICWGEGRSSWFPLELITCPVHGKTLAYKPRGKVPEWEKKAIKKVLI